MAKISLAVVCALALVVVPVLGNNNRAPLGAGIPAGTSMFFNSDACPTGWSELPAAQGRLVVSVTDPANSGLTVGDALKNLEEPTHVHAFNASVTLPSHHIAAAGCCNDQGAAHGTYYSLPGDSTSSTSGLPFTQMVLCRLDAEDPTIQVPFGTVAYFDGTVPACPDNWEAYDAAAGRTMVPGYTALAGITRSDSAPLSNQEDRVHKHTFNTTTQTDPVSYAGIDGCCNDSPSGSGSFETLGVAEGTSANVPYYQMLTCVSRFETFNVSLPKETLLWNPVTGCPSGWQLASTVSGRMLVVNPEDGSAGASFGSVSLGQHSTQEATHQHSVTGEIPTHATGVGLASGCCAGGYAAADTYKFDTDTTHDVVDFPWLMVTMCEQV